MIDRLHDIAVRLRSLLGVFVLICLHLTAAKSVQYLPFRGSISSTPFHGSISSTVHVHHGLHKISDIFIAARSSCLLASSSSLFCPFLGDERPNIRPSTTQNTSSTSHHHGHRDMHFALRPQAVSARVDLRCPSVYTLCWMQPYRPPSVHIGSM